MLKYLQLVWYSWCSCICVYSSGKCIWRVKAPKLQEKISPYIVDSCIFVLEMVGTWLVQDWRSVSWRGYRGLPNQIGGELSELLGSQPGSEQHQPTAPQHHQHPAQQTTANLLYFKYLGLRETRNMCLLSCTLCHTQFHCFTFGKHPLIQFNKQKIT